VYETVTKCGHPVCRCGIEDPRNDRSVEVPAWMFEAAACDHLRLTATRVVDCQALIALKAMFQTVPRADVLQAPHHSLTAPGGADATDQTPIPNGATDAVPSLASAPALSDVATGHPGADDSTGSRDCCVGTPISRSSRMMRGRRVMSDKIRPQHVARKAILYVRQSSAYQVNHNVEPAIAVRDARPIASVRLARGRRCG
jgi:hypothetical protein